ncbi:aminotransferase class I/II-fold pyridoxal phosphate-dependent enzyme [Desulfovibrionales bacterium]
MNQCRINPCCQDLTSFKVMDVLERACALKQAGRDIVHLHIGEPDFDTPECIKEAACKAIRDGCCHYTHSLGILELREAISQHYHNTYGVSVHPDQILVTSGTSAAMLLVFSLLFQPQDRVLLADPSYACYPNFIRFAGAVPEFLPVREQDGFQFLPEILHKRMGEDVRGILVNSPANPTGTLLEPEVFRSLADTGVPILSDEIYHGLVYGDKAHTALEFTENCFVFNGFSKLYAMTGWRLGYVIAPRAYMNRLQAMQQNFFLCTNSIAQWAGIAALTQAGPDVERMRAMYNERRKLMMTKLRNLGFGIQVEPTGAFYVFANARCFTADSMHFTFDLLERAGVGVAPGVDFGSGGEGFLRFSYANSMENIERGMERIQKYLEAVL